MIVLYKFVPYWKVPDISPFVTKLETYLRMARIPYQTAIGDTRKAPKKKLPYIEDEGRFIADSSLIIEHLQKKHGDVLEDGRFDARERAVIRAFKALCETDFYFVLAYIRWWHDDSFDLYKPALLHYADVAKVPGLLRAPILAWLRRGMRQQLFQQGIGRHQREEVTAIGQGHLDALADFLGDKPYFMGDRPCTLDATVYASLINLIWTPFGGPLKDYAQSRPNLSAYCERMHAAYWKETT
jgi:glutathione S-transferase